MKKLLLLLCFVNFCAFAHDPFFENKTTGWFWYREKLQVAKPKTLPRDIPSHKQVDIDKEKLDQALKTAYEIPTEENLIKFIQLRNRVLDKSYNFGLKLHQVSLLHPELDKLTTYPSNGRAKEIYMTNKQQEVTTKIARLAQKYGLFYVFESTCPYCHAFAPTVKSFAKRFGWQILPITLDGKAIADFPEAQKDNGMAKKLKITSLPTLVMVDPKLGKTIPIAVGVISEEEIIERIDLLTREVQSL